MTQSPAGFVSWTANLGIKDGSRDFAVLASTVPCTAAGVFTRSLFSGPSVVLSRRHLAEGRPRAIVTVSKNANVATGEQGAADARELAGLVAAGLDLAVEDVLVSSTGVIGRPYPMDRIRAGLAGPPEYGPLDLDAVARAIITTDTRPKVASARVGAATLGGVAKGVGMIEPDMATLLTYFVTDAAITAEVLDPMFRRVMDRTFNCLSIDTDTSTSDSAVILANGLAGPVDADEFEVALEAVARSLVEQVARDGEGATKLLTVTVVEARDPAQAKRLAKYVVNSPLVKTAVHGADPNWGRVVMAVGKSSGDTDVTPETVRVRFGDIEVYPTDPSGVTDRSTLDKLTELLRADSVEITVTAGTGSASATVWGCDLSDGYVRINADYTT
jgi:glutamate N-acetyltransferase / amino-acid N-acetyltransferase